MIKRYKYTLILSAIIFYLSLKSADDLNKVQILNIPHIDKIAHLCMYFALMSALILEKRILSKKRDSFLLLSLFPFFYGILLEILQASFTTTRSGSAIDVIFNTVGIILSVVTWSVLKNNYREKFK